MLLPIMQKKFTQIFSDKITREGASDLLSFLQDEDKSDFYTAPCSRSYKNVIKGGLVCHSINVYETLKTFCDMYSEKIGGHKFNEESIAIIGLLHDLWQVNYYISTYKDVRNPITGRWNKKAGYEIKDTFALGQTEATLFIIQKYMKLTHEEALCIRWILNYNSSEQSESFEVAVRKTPLIILSQMADRWTSKFLEAEMGI